MKNHTKGLLVGGRTETSVREVRMSEDDLVQVAGPAPDSIAEIDDELSGEKPPVDIDARIRDAFESLSKIEKDIVRHTVGFEVKNRLTTEETSQLLGYTEEQIRIIKAGAFETLREKILSR